MMDDQPFGMQYADKYKEIRSKTWTPIIKYGDKIHNSKT